ncbi:MAG: asparaginase, partial [Longispora sp.]|nr:asparaginase [Longispora sp. (in: high G+C Gram-positive bacteria)]
GRLVHEIGDASGPIFPRSSNKPMQAAGMLRAGYQPRDTADLALAAASHFGEPMHVDRVRAMLTAGGLDVTALACPPDLPSLASARQDVLAAGGGPDRLFMNCSGKHAAMVLTCVTAGWPVDGYLNPDHPLQVCMRDEVERVIDGPVAAAGVDGCGAPVFAMSLRRLAGAFLTFVSAAPGSPERRVADAMREFPELMSGTGANDARLMRGVPGLLAKIGAEGVVAVAVPGVGAVAVKIDDGASRARTPAVIAGLRQLGVSNSALDELSEQVILGGDHPVGAIRLVL